MERTLPALRPLVIPIGVVTFGVSIALLAARSPHAIFRAEPFAEDGTFYGAALERGVGTLLEPHAGYLVVGQRALTLPELLVSPALTPLAGSILAITAMAAVAGYLASVLPRGWLVAVAFVLVPESQMLIGTLSHVQWAAAAFLAAVPLTAPPSGWRRIAEVATLMVAGLTGPFSVLFLPLYLRGPRYRLVIVGAAAGVQVAVFLVADRLPSVPVDWSLLPYLVALRGLVTPLVGHDVAALLPPPVIVIGAVAIAGAVALALRPFGWRPVYVAAAPVLVGVLTSPRPTNLFLDPAFAPRYFWLAGIVAAAAILLTIRRPTSLALAGLLAVGMVTSFHHDAPPIMGWAEHSACIGGPLPCEVRVYPDEDRFAVRWQP